MNFRRAYFGIEQILEFLLQNFRAWDFGLEKDMLNWVLFFPINENIF